MGSPLNFHPKVVGGILGSVSGGTVVWLLSLMHVEVTLPEAVALLSVVSAFGGWLAPILKTEASK